MKRVDALNTIIDKVAIGVLRKLKAFQFNVAVGNMKNDTKKERRSCMYCPESFVRLLEDVPRTLFCFTYL